MAEERDPFEVFAAAIAQLPIESLHAERARLENSIEHLVKSNTEIHKYIEAEETETKEEKIEMAEVITENEEVITKQKLQIEMVKSEIVKRSR
ncbi:uncharacterized protein V2V93DRAFT_380149 [Kockiozyma suomiensis]|uniref:uncharacterized protein n=1 Tax=Kockiozyma suomiensis TaxID=1337062 RepID=UPI003343C954